MNWQLDHCGRYVSSSGERESDAEPEWRVRLGCVRACQRLHAAYSSVSPVSVSCGINSGSSRSKS